MEKLQLKMKMLNVALAEEQWTAYDVLIKFWTKLGVKDETAIIGGILSAGISTILTDVMKIKARDPELLGKLKSIEIDKGGINEMFNVTI